MLGKLKVEGDRKLPMKLGLMEPLFKQACDIVRGEMNTPSQSPQEGLDDGGGSDDTDDSDSQSNTSSAASNSTTADPSAETPLVHNPLADRIRATFVALQGLLSEELVASIGGVFAVNVTSGVGVGKQLEQRWILDLKYS